MKIVKKFISFLMITVMLVGTYGTVNAQAKQGYEKATTFEKDYNNTTDTLNEMNTRPTANSGLEDIQYPYSNLEEPATINGFDFEFKDNVEFLPQQAEYNIVPAPVGQSGSGNSTSGSVGLQVPSVNNSVNIKNYLPGTKLMKLRDENFVPEKNKIYIDGDDQSTFKVIDDAIEQSGKIEAAVVKPSADEVFDGVYIPRQEIAMTKGNITDMADGVELVTKQNSIRSLSTDTATTEENQLPAPDESRNYHEFKIPSIKIYPFSGNKDELPKGKTEDDSSNPTPSPSPTPHPEDRDAKDEETGSNMDISIRIKGGRIRIYEPTLVAESSWTGNFDLGFESIKVESSVTLEGNLNFSKESCTRLYGYGVDFDSGSEIAGHRIAAHLGIGIYAVFGINGEIKITAKVEQAGTISGGVTGNFWPILLGTPSAIPYATYNSEKFDVAIMLDAKIHAWAYVGPQITLDILDFNLLTVQVWVGMEGDAIVHAEAAAGTGTQASASFQMDLSLDFVVLFRAWVFDYPFEYYLVDLNIYKKTLQFKTGESASDTTQTLRNYTPVINLDGVDAYWNTIWGSASYYDELSRLQPIKEVPVNITVTKQNNQVQTYQATTDTEGKFILEVPGGLMPTDKVMVSINYQTTAGNVVTNYNAALLQPVSPTIPFGISIMEADGFNDRVVGSIAPAVACPGHEGEQYYNGNILITIVDENGTTIRTKRMAVNKKDFVATFSNQDDLSGGHIAYATLVYKGQTNKSNEKKADLSALKMNIGCQVDGIDADLIIEALMKQDNELLAPQGIKVSQIEFAGTITNIKAKKPYEGTIKVTVNQSDNYTDNIPVTVIPIKLQSMGITIPQTNTHLNENALNLLKSSVSTFDNTDGLLSTWNKKTFLRLISFTLEYENMLKCISYCFASNDNPTIVTGQVNPIDQIMIDKIDSRINPVEVVFSVGNSQMSVNGSMMPIDGTSNTSVMQVNGNTYVPAKAVMEALGGTCSDSIKTGKTTLKLNSISIIVSNGKKGIKVNGNSKNLTVAPFKTSDGVLMIPTAMLSAQFGYNAKWNNKTKSLTITQVKSKTTDKTKQETTKTDTTNNEETPWTGVWDSSFGTLLLTQTGTKVTGTYGNWEDNCLLSGTVKSGKLTGNFEEDGEKGVFIFTLNKDGTFTGKFHYNNKSEWSVWKGEKITDDFGIAKTAWGGVWNTDLGAMVLKQSGTEVTGIYRPDNYILEGTVSGKVLTATFKEGSKSGEYVITINKEQDAFSGEYKYDGDDDWTSFEGIKIR